MALDVYLLDSDAAPPVGWPVCQFEEPIHSAIFFGGVLAAGQYPLLRQMQDYYADARYGGEDLPGLVEELQEVLPRFADDPRCGPVLRRFLEVCRQAVSQGKVVWCFCD